MEKMSNIEKGNQFENQVASIFELLDYEVSQNVNMCGQQIDIYVKTIIPGGIENRIIIECKYRKKGISIGNDIFNDFYGAFSNVHNKGLADYGMIITNQKFTAQAKAAALNTRVKLLTYNELLNKIINFNKYLNSIINEYENFNKIKLSEKEFLLESMSRCDINNEYVANNCYKLEEDESNIQRVLNDFIKLENKHLALLGDYGSGKTSSLLKFTYEMAFKFLNTKYTNSHYLPIFISLKDISKNEEFTQAVFRIITEKYGVFIKDINTLKSYIYNNNVILIYDGFDEMHNTSNRRIIKENFIKILNFSGNKTKTIISSRTHFFNSYLQEKEFFNTSFSEQLTYQFSWKKDFSIYYLSEFNNDDIKKYLNKNTKSPNKLLKKIKATYNLEDLSKRPILLKMITVTLKDIDEHEDINISSLYKLYTNIWIEREDWHSHIKCETKLKFMVYLSSQMFENSKNDYSLFYEDLLTPIKNFFKFEIDNKEIEIIDNEIRTCSFLNRDEEGNYRFIHKSFMEYFIAAGLSEFINQENFLEALKFKQTVEIMSFTLFLIKNKTLRDKYVILYYIQFGWQDRGLNKDLLTNNNLVEILNHSSTRGSDKAQISLYIAERNLVDNKQNLLNCILFEEYIYAKQMSVLSLVRLYGKAIIPELNDFLNNHKIHNSVKDYLTYLNTKSS